MIFQKKHLQARLMLSVLIATVSISLATAEEPSKDPNDPTRISAEIMKSSAFKKLPELWQNSILCFASGGINSFKNTFCDQSFLIEGHPIGDLTRIINDRTDKIETDLNEKIKSGKTLSADEQNLIDFAQIELKSCQQTNQSESRDLINKNLESSLAAIKPENIPVYTNGPLSKEQALLLAANPFFPIPEFGEIELSSSGLDFAKQEFAILSALSTLPDNGLLNKELELSPYLQPHRTVTFLDNPDLLKDLLIISLKTDRGLREANINDVLHQLKKVELINDSELSSSFKTWLSNEIEYQHAIRDFNWEKNVHYTFADHTPIYGTPYKSILLDPLNIPLLQGKEQPKALANIDGERDNEFQFKKYVLNVTPFPNQIVDLNFLQQKGLKPEHAQRFLVDLHSALNGKENTDQETLIAKSLLSKPSEIKNLYEISLKMVRLKNEVQEYKRKEYARAGKFYGKKPEDPNLSVCERAYQNQIHAFAIGSLAISFYADPKVKERHEKSAQDIKGHVLQILKKSLLSDESKAIILSRLDALKVSTPSFSKESFSLGLANRISLYRDLKKNHELEFTESDKVGIASYVGIMNPEYYDSLRINASYDSEKHQITVDGGYLLPEATDRHLYTTNYVIGHEIGHSISPFAKDNDNNLIMKISKHSSQLFAEVQKCLKSEITLEEDFADMIGYESLADLMEEEKNKLDSETSRIQLIQDNLSRLCNRHKLFFDLHSPDGQRALIFLSNPSIKKQFNIFKASLPTSETPYCGASLWPAK